MIKYLIILSVITILLFLYIIRNNKDIFIPATLLVIIFLAIVIFAFLGY